MSLLSAVVEWLLDVIALLRWAVGIGMLVSGLLVVPFGVILPAVWKWDILGVQSLYDALRFLPGLSADGSRRAIAVASVYTLLAGVILIAGGTAMFPSDSAGSTDLTLSQNPQGPMVGDDPTTTVDRSNETTAANDTSASLDADYLALSGADSTKTSTETNVPSISSPSAVS